MKCSKCNKSMKIRINKKDGNKFWGCTGYPKCKHTKRFVDNEHKPPARESLGENMIQWCIDVWNNMDNTLENRELQQNIRRKVTDGRGKIDELPKEIQLEIILVYGTQQLIKTIKESQYKLYLTSDEWKEKRELVIERDHNACRICGLEDDLQVHHLTYDRIFNESLYDLVTICKICHNRIHA